MATAGAGCADKGSSQAPARSARLGGAATSRSAARVSAETKGKLGQPALARQTREIPA
ncbi:protein of unknown function (plasmid) [Methylocella tundrae]|uniref:Uncharacterized protein n=1 Tax=Methylocella tundrae TaxID=227605 RepID=A0A4U8Z713_METTU|nr:protein of unknown function [Methylocella tundrae]